MGIAANLTAHIIPTIIHGMNTPDLKTIDLNSFGNTPDVMDGQKWVYIVKSCDQVARRQRMISAFKKGSVMGLDQRPVADGLLFEASFSKGQLQVNRSKAFREPRHIRAAPSGNGYWLTEIDRLLQLDDAYEVVREIRNDLFAFLHTIDFSADGKRALICSTGYDTLLEIDLQTGAEIYRWNAWSHGFNPDKENNWLTLDEREAEQYRQQGHNVKLVKPSQTNPHGTIMHHKTAHPNAAIYDVTDPDAILVSIAWSGTIYSIDRKTGKTTPRTQLSAMPHGLAPYKDGWCVTDTTRGAWVRYSAGWQKTEDILSHNLPFKCAESEDREWLQQAMRVNDDQLLYLDANRGIIAADLQRKAYTCYLPDPNYCIQDALKIG